MYWGIDGCKQGWIAIGLDDTGEYKSVHALTIDDFWAQYGQEAQSVLIDMPIGLASDAEGRLADSAARDVLGKRRSSVFSVPTREAIMYGVKHDFNRETFQNAIAINREVEGKGFSMQGWYISGKIAEVDRFLRNHTDAQAIFAEAHPEVLFWALNDQTPMDYSKKTGLGFLERVTLLEHHQSNAVDIIRKAYDEYSSLLVDDDIVDALACAVCARIGNLQSLPASPKLDEFGLPMQIVYPKVNGIEA